MKTRFNLLIHVEKSSGYRLARVNIDVSQLTQQDKDLIMEHYLMHKVEGVLSKPETPWSEGDFMTIDAKGLVPEDVSEIQRSNAPDITLEGLKGELDKKSASKAFLSTLSPAMRSGVEKLLKQYSVEEIKEALKGK